MGLKSFFKKLFGSSETVENLKNETATVLPVVEGPQKKELPTTEVDNEKNLQIIENRLNEINSEKKEVKRVTAKEIKAKVKSDKTPTVEKTSKPKSTKPKTTTEDKKVSKKKPNK